MYFFCLGMPALTRSAVLQPGRLSPETSNIVFKVGL